MWWRVAKAGDEAAVVEVVRQVYAEYGFTWDPEGYHRDLYDLSAHFSPPGGYLLIGGLEEGKVQGCCGITLHPSPGEKEVVVREGELPRLGRTDAELHRLYVIPAARRGGLGRQLTLLCFDWARGAGARAVEIWSDKRFDQAHRLYRDLGAVCVVDRICDDPDVSPEWGYRLDLRPPDRR